MFSDQSLAVLFHLFFSVSQTFAVSEIMVERHLQVISREFLHTTNQDIFVLMDQHFLVIEPHIRKKLFAEHDPGALGLTGTIYYPLILVVNVIVRPYKTYLFIVVKEVTENETCMTIQPIIGI